VAGWGNGGCAIVFDAGGDDDVQQLLDLYE